MKEPSGNCRFIQSPVGAWLGVLALALVGLVVGALLARNVEAHLSRSHMDGYTYDGSHTTCVDPHKWKDPITVGFAYGAMPDLVEHHAVEHGYQPRSSSDQRFYDHGLCAVEQVDVATPGSAGFHMRARTGDDVDPTWGVFAVGTPHRDQEAGPDDWDCFNQWPFEGHYVPEDYNGLGYSGFVAGRIDIVEQWVNQGEHIAVTYENWWNNAAIEQCNGERPRSANAGGLGAQVRGRTAGACKGILPVNL